jgi:hypothetical protein
LLHPASKQYFATLRVLAPDYRWTTFADTFQPRNVANSLWW